MQTRQKLSLSFEFFPPRSEAGEEALWECIQQLAPLQPDFVSVTYGAGGTTRDRTHRLVKRIREQTDLEPAAHLTCVGASRDEINRIAESYWKDGIRHIVALRGDATPEMGGTYVPHPQGYAYADTLVAGLKEIGDFEISVAAYPETHPQAKTRDEDLRHLKRKFDAGASLAISQYCFDMDYYKAFLAKLPEYDIDPATVVPGILPIGNFTQMAKFSAMCGASVPAWLQNRFEGEDPAGAMHAQLAVATAYKQALDYLATGTQRLHFYTLNRADLVMAVCRLLGIRG